MTKMKTSLLAAAAIGALSLGYSTDANATAYALTHDLISQLTFSADASDESGLIAFGSFNFSASTSASLNPGGSAGDSDSSTTAFSDDRDISTGTGSGADGSVDPLPANVGTASNANGDFSANGQTGADYARADHHLSDTLINNAGLGACGGGSTCGGDFESVTEAFVSGSSAQTQQGNSAAGNQQSWDLDFDVPAGGADITIEFNLDLTQIAELNGETSPAQATSSFNLGFTVSGAGDFFLASFLQAITANENESSTSADAFDLTPNGVGTGAVSIADSDNGDGTRHFIVTFHVGAGAKSLVINYQASAGAVSVVPEPVTLGLLGAGLLGLGALARRRKVVA